MNRKQIIITEVQDLVFLACLKHTESGIWREHSEAQVFDDLSKAREWAAKECHRILNNMVQRANVLPYSSSVRWLNDYELSMSLCSKEGKVIDHTEVNIYKKDIL